MKLKVTFLPEQITIPALPENTILELAREAGIDIAAQCGGTGSCGKCLVRIAPAPPPTAAEKKILPAGRLAEGWRLACRCRVGHHDLAVTVPPENRLLNLETLAAGLGRTVPLNPGNRSYFLALSPPTIEDQAPDRERVCRALAEETGRPAGSFHCPPPLLRQLPAVLRQDRFRATFTLAGGTIIDVRPGRADARSYGLAFDLGTTSIVGALVESDTAREAGVAGAANPQARYGADVVNRISYTQENADGAARLARETIATLNSISRRLCRAAGIEARQVAQVIIAGNTVMEHLLLQVPAASLAASPYTGVFRTVPEMPAAELGLAVNEHAPVFLAPLISGYVGGDTTAGILATNQHRERPVRLFVDIGTNGEIVLGNDRGLWCAAAAAGPAFEGACISQGMRSEPGAIDKVRLGRAVHYTTIDEKPARGICGTGLIELVSELLRLDVISVQGQIRPDEELAGLAPALRERISGEGGDRCFRITPEQGVAVFQKDIRQLQLAKSAIASGIEILLGKLRLGPGDIDEVFLAGAFGSYIDPVAALRIGLLPAVPPEKIRFLGNTALAGARMMVVSEAMKEEARAIPDRCRCVELFHEPDFMDLFVTKMSFPG